MTNLSIHFRYNGVILFVIYFLSARGWQPVPYSRLPSLKSQKQRWQPFIEKPNYSHPIPALNLFDEATSAAENTTTPLTGEQECKNKEEEPGGSTSKNLVPSATFNLIKAMIGSGVLALPAGVAANSDYKTA